MQIFFTHSFVKVELLCVCFNMKNEWEKYNVQWLRQIWRNIIFLFDWKRLLIKSIGNTIQNICTLFSLQLVPVKVITYLHHFTQNTKVYTKIYLHKNQNVKRHKNMLGTKAFLDVIFAVNFQGHVPSTPANAYSTN